MSQIFSLLSWGPWKEDGRRGCPAGTERLDLLTKHHSGTERPSNCLAEVLSVIEKGVMEC